MASLSKICEFCLETVLLTKTSWGYHQPSRWSLANSARHGCTFCKVIYEDVQSRLEIMKSYECDSDFLRHWLLDEVVDTDQSLYRWSLRSLGRAREDKKTMAITFRPIPVRVQSLDPTQAPATLGLPERVFYCFPEAELGKLLNTSELGKTTDPFVTGGQQIMNWMEECSTKHSNCPKLAGSAIIFVPTRLLHIGGRRPGDAIKVVDTKSGNVRSAYVTLSHCWGQLPLITLQSSTVKEFTTVGVPWHQLSSNFQQAIEVAWFLKIDYIWIDSRKSEYWHRLRMHES